jgi:brefeldin A-inhibited guanine nucleotide-exchange protein
MSDSQVPPVDSAVPEEKAFNEDDTVEIPLEEPTDAISTPATPPKDQAISPIEPEESTPIVNLASVSGLNGEQEAAAAVGGNQGGRDTPPPPPPPKAEELTSPAPATPAKTRPDIPRDNSKASLQDVALSRGPTPAGMGAGPIPTIQRTRSSASTSSRAQHHPSASVTSLASVSGTGAGASPSRPPSAFRPRMTSEHSRRSSVATTISLSNQGQGGHGPAPPQLSSVLITPPLKVLVDSKEAKKSASFAAAAQRALELCSQEGPSNSAYLHPREIFEPLRLAIANPQTTSVPILITSLDLLSKLVSHSFFSEPNGPPKGLSPLPDLITHTITLAYSESSPPQVALQVVKALMAIVLSTDKGMLVHQSSLLKAVRTVYNVFLLSNDAPNQVVAQGGLTQMVHHVFGRVVRPNPNASSAGMGRRGTVGENEARRLEKEAEDEAARLAAEGTGEKGQEAEANGQNGEAKLTL